MTAPVRPAAASLYGKETWYFVTAVASASFIPTAAEVNAGTSIDITKRIFADSGQPDQSTNRVTQERRFGDTVLAEFVGAASITGGSLHYSFDPQAAAGTEGKKLFAAIPAGTSAFLVHRPGLSAATTPAAGQFVNCYPVTFGPPFPSPAGDNETKEAGMKSEFAVTDPNPAINVALT